MQAGARAGFGGREEHRGRPASWCLDEAEPSRSVARVLTGKEPTMTLDPKVLDLDKLERLNKVATSGSWWWDFKHYDDGSMLAGVEASGIEGHYIAIGRSADTQAQTDMEFIAELRNQATDLISAARERERLQQRLDAILRHWQYGIGQLDNLWRLKMARLVGDREGLAEVADLDQGDRDE